MGGRRAPQGVGVQTGLGSSHKHKQNKGDNQSNACGAAQGAHLPSAPLAPKRIYSDVGERVPPACSSHRRGGRHPELSRGLSRSHLAY